MDVSRVSRNDWIIGGGFVLMFIGTVAPWYGVDLGFASVTANGWHGSYLGWLTFILCLAAALVVFRHVVADDAIALPVPDAVIAVACGGVSALIVVIRILTKPQFTGLRWGIFVSLVGALVVAAAGFLKYGEVARPAPATGPPPQLCRPRRRRRKPRRRPAPRNAGSCDGACTSCPAASSGDSCSCCRSWRRLRRSRVRPLRCRDSASSAAAPSRRPRRASAPSAARRGSRRRARIRSRRAARVLVGRRHESLVVGQCELRIL